MDRPVVVAAVLASGRGNRFGGDKVQAILGGRPVWRWSYDTLRAHPRVDRVVVVSREALEADWVVPGGDTRQQSSRAAVEAAVGADIVLIHDAARPFLTPEIIDRVIDGVIQAGAAAAAVKVTDTIKQRVDGRVTTLDRDTLWAMQTPQGATRDMLIRAHSEATSDLTDEMALIEALGVHPLLVEGSPDNFKITTPSDLERARAQLGPAETRTGLGYDVHRFSSDPTRTLMLGGLAFPGHAALDGHSDADVILHAAVDAILGAASLGDIGQHFPPDDPQWLGEPSLTFLKAAGRMLAQGGWRLVNLDIAVIAESPKVMKRATEMRERIAGVLQIEASRVSVKATTNEGLGSIGRGEGIACFATATISNR